VNRFVQRGPRRSVHLLVRSALVIALLVAAYHAVSAREKAKPKILAIVQVQILASDTKKADDFYYGILRTLAPPKASDKTCSWCEGAPIGGTDPLIFEAVAEPLPKNLIGSITFLTDDAEGLRNNLKQKNLKVGALDKGSSGITFGTTDPEGHILVFAQRSPNQASSRDFPGAYAYAPSWPNIIHAGFVVKDRAVMDKFYKDILGFHVYWSGGMKDGVTDWVDMQVPDGADWIEYMLNVPDNADKQTLGVMNHIALGVPDVRAAAKELEAKGMKWPEPPQIGRDGKWQLNLYDPDKTRVELMEFTPTEKPCCSEYTGPHPKP
jgi:catechol 2,3-dioxygenase-like lactoylglutathione lyase family enzyme